MEDISEIEPGVYLGGAFILLTNPTVLYNEGFTHVIDLTNEFPTLVRYPGLFEYCIVPIADASNAADELYRNLDKIHSFVTKALTKPNAKVFMHCNCGVSRSATVMISFIMKHKKLSLRDAYLYVKKRRDLIQPNVSFMQMLMEFEKSLGMKPSLSVEEYLRMIT